jgi:hypothetical protein
MRIIEELENRTLYSVSAALDNAGTLRVEVSGEVGLTVVDGGSGTVSISEDLEAPTLYAGVSRLIVNADAASQFFDFFGTGNAVTALGSVLIDGNGGSDVFRASSGTNTLTLKGGSGDDVFRIESGTATVIGQGGDDTAELDETATALLRGVESVVAV